ncbi:permease [Elioraea tepidiphila]|jgi:uncharacterized membrane protein YraQ (UPF0718 family)|uniref:permease n=1 Tax=Elioraea tepidiphila TaxID=457934 RepID=UPI002FDB7AC2
MTTTTPAIDAAVPPKPDWRARLRRADRVLLAIAAILIVLLIAAPGQAFASLRFLAGALASIAPFLAISVLVAGWAKATGADQQVARAFQGHETVAILAAAGFGALSPFCSCGVIPLIAGLLAAGVPIAPVMAFWLASPLMDPNQFAILVGAIGFEFAVAKTLAALGIGLLGGFGTLAIVGAGGLADPLRPTVGRPSACRAKRSLKPPAPVWRFWTEPERAQMFVTESGRSAWFLLRWLSLAFLIESLMVVWVPGEAVARLLGEGNAFAIPLAVLLGVPAYLNGFAAIPLVSGLIGLGMSPAVGLTFMLAGGVTSIPAAMAVWALVKPRVFAAYLAFAALGALAAGYAFMAVMAWA